MNYYAPIQNAIENNYSLTCFVNNAYRKVVPFLLGVKDDKKHIVFYEYGGAKKDEMWFNPTSNWQCYSLETIEYLTINNDKTPPLIEQPEIEKMLDIIEVRTHYSQMS